MQLNNQEVKAHTTCIQMPFSPCVTKAFAAFLPPLKLILKKAKKTKSSPCSELSGLFVIMCKVLWGP